MPQIGVTTEGYGQTGPSVFDYPKLEPIHKDEFARIFIPDPNDVWTEFRHSIGGQRAAKGLPPGSPIPGWGGNWICTGRDEVMRASNPSLDPEACVSCKAHRDGDPVVDKPTRKYVTQIFRYATDPSGLQLMQPFSVALKIWLLNDKEFGSIKQIGASWGDLRRFDLLLKALSKEFKTWEVQPQPQALWATNPEWQAVVQQAYANQHIPIADLSLLIGRRATNDNEILAKIQEVKMAGQQPQGYYQPPPQGWPQPGQQAPGYFPGVMPQQQQPMYAPPAGPPELAAPPPLAGAPIPPAPLPDLGQQLQAPPPMPTMQAPPPAVAPPAQQPMMMPPPPSVAPGAIQQPMMQPPSAPMMQPPSAPQQQLLQPPPPMVAPPATQPPPAPNGAAPQAVDFTSMMGVPPAPPPPPA